MKRFLVVLLGALVFAQAAFAHDAYRDNREDSGVLFWGLITEYRSNIGAYPTVPNLATAAMATFIQTCNWTEKKWGNGCGGDPFPVWSTAAAGKNPRGLVRINQCHVGEPGNPSFNAQEAFNILKSRPGANSVFRLPLWQWMETKSQLIHAHSGFYAGKGKCVSYTSAWMAPLASGRPIIGSSDLGETYEDVSDS